MRHRMSTALTVISMALMLPVCTLVGVIVGHKLTIKSQNQPPTNEQNNSSNRN